MSEMCCTRLAENTGRKNRHFGTIAQLCRAVSSQLRHVSTTGKNLLNIDTSSTCRPTHNDMVNFGLVTAENRWRVWGTPANFNGFCVLPALLHGTLVVGRQPNFVGVEQRAPPAFGRETITLGIGPHSSLIIIFLSPVRNHTLSVCNLQ